jgi:hypothetical protein
VDALIPSESGRHFVLPKTLAGIKPVLLCNAFSKHIFIPFFVIRRHAMPKLVGVIFGDGPLEIVSLGVEVAP